MSENNGNQLLIKLKKRYDELPDDYSDKYKLKEVIDIIEAEENKPKPIEIDETLLKDAITIWSEMKPALKNIFEFK